MLLSHVPIQYEGPSHSPLNGEPVDPKDVAERLDIPNVEVEATV